MDVAHTRQGSLTLRPSAGAAVAGRAGHHMAGRKADHRADRNLVVVPGTPVEVAAGSSLLEGGLDR